MSKTASYWVIIPAAGSGRRFLSEVPKQYLSLQGKTVLEHSLQFFLDDPLNKGVIVAIEKDNPYFAKLPLASHPKIHQVDGGEQRCQSVLNALWYLQSCEHVDQHTRVLVHDAARPCLDQQALTDLLLFPLTEHNAALLATPVNDTLKHVNEKNQVEATVDRSAYMLAQTPQMAELATLLHALEHALDNGKLPTDESSALEYLGIEVTLINSPATNIKITHPGDLEIAEFILNSKQLKNDKEIK